MQITNNTYTNYNQAKSISKNEESSETSFSSMLANNTEKSEDKEKMGKYVTYLDKFNVFDSFSAEEKKVFREILKDDKIILSEMDSLSYEQVERFFHVALPQGDFSKEQLDNTPIVNMSNQIIEMLFTTRTTNNKTFNKALYQTAKEINDDDFRRNIFGELQTNLFQAHFGFEILPSFNAGASRGNLWKDDIDSMNIDFNKFLYDVINLHEKAIANPKTHPAVIHQHQRVLDGYNIIKKHYDKLQSEIKSYA